MPGFICATCGVQYPDSETPPVRCIICEDERQYVPAGGQQWTTPAALTAGYRNFYQQLAPGLLGIGTTPTFGIGQRALLLRTPQGNVLWDCISLLDEATVEIISALGGLAAIVVSHPHYYSTMASWGQAFDCPVHVHDADREWVVSPDPCIQYWQGETLEVLPDITAHRLGGHFPGASVLHRASQRLLLTGDTLLVTPERRYLSFMWSYPNNIPLPADKVEQIGRYLSALDFDSIYASFWQREITHDAKRAVELSVDRHCRAVTGQLPM